MDCRRFWFKELLEIMVLADSNSLYMIMSPKHELPRYPWCKLKIGIMLSLIISPKLTKVSWVPHVQPKMVIFPHLTSADQVPLVQHKNTYYMVISPKLTSVTRCNPKIGIIWSFPQN